MATTPTAALATALERLVAAQTLSRPQADAVIGEFRTEIMVDDDPSFSSRVAEVGGYVGAAFVFAAVVALVGSFWDDLGTAGRVLVPAVPGAILLAAAVILFRGALSPARRRLVAVLLLAGGASLGGAASQLDPHADAWRVIPWVLLAVWATGYFFVRGWVLHLATAAAVGWSVAAALSGFSSAGPIGFALVAIGALWATAADHLPGEQELGIAVGGVLWFVGAQIVVVDSVRIIGYALLVLLAVVGLGGYLRTHLLSALGVGAVSLAVVVPQAVIDYTDGSLGAAGALLVSGLSIVGVSVAALRLRQETQPQPPSP